MIGHGYYKSTNVILLHYVRLNTESNNIVDSNYWNTYDCVDANWDGIGDTPYNGDTHPLMASIDVDVIPEFPSWTPLLIMLVAVMVVAVIYKRRLEPQTN